ALGLGGPLPLHVAEEVAGGALGLADLVQVEGHGDACLRDEAGDLVVRQWAPTEPLRVPSAALQWVVARDPDEERPVFLAGQLDACVEVEHPGDGVAPFRQ